jgi:hypothetical protein
VRRRAAAQEPALLERAARQGGPAANAQRRREPQHGQARPEAQLRVEAPEREPAGGGPWVEPRDATPPEQEQPAQAYGAPPSLQESGSKERDGLMVERSDACRQTRPAAGESARRGRGSEAHPQPEPSPHAHRDDLLLGPAARARACQQIRPWLLLPADAQRAPDGSPEFPPRLRLWALPLRFPSRGAHSSKARGFATPRRRPRQSNWSGSSCRRGPSRGEDRAGLRASPRDLLPVR